MPDRYIDSHIKLIPLFANLSREELFTVSQAFEVRSYRAQEVIFREGEPTEGMITIISGRAVFLQIDQSGIQQPIGVANPNQTINQEALFQSGTQTATLYVQQPVVALKLTRQSFMNLLAHHHELKAKFGLSPKDTTHHAHDVRFSGQRENEEVFLYTHRHWWAFARMAWLPLFAMVGLWIIAIVLAQPLISTILFIVSIVFPGLLLLYMYVEWRNDSVIVTDQRVVRITRTILQFSTNISEIGIQSIHEINSEIPSHDPFARIFNYGTIQLKTAGDAGNLTLDHIPDPDKFQEIIIEDRNHYAQRQAQSHHNTVRAELDRWLSGEQPQKVANSMSSQPSPNRTPRPTSGGFGFLRTRIPMDNGDIIYRKHVITWFQKTILPILLMIIAVGEVILSITANVSLLGLPIGMVVFLIGAIAFYWADWDWRNDYYVVADTTITLIHQRPLWLENLRDQILMERVDNVVSDSSGILPSLFNYGNVRVSLIGADQPKLFRSVPDPRGIQQEISRRQQRLKQRQSQNEARQQREIIGEYLNAFNDRLQQQGLINNPQATQAQPTQPAYDPNAPFANVAGGTPPSSINNTGQTDSQSVEIRALPSQDRNRPPNIPRKRFPVNPQKPSLSPGVPYDPSENRPPRIPRSDNTN